MRDSNRQWIFAERPEEELDVDSSELHKDGLPEPRHEELPVRVRYLSVDPYMRGRMRDTESYAEPRSVGDPMQGVIVGEVIESESDAYDAGDLVSGSGTWADYTVLDANSVAPVNPLVADLPAYLGVLRMPDRTAYFGLLEVGDPSPGETVVVSGAAGAAGSIVGQIARFNGCRVVGFVGSDEKVSWLTDDFGFDAAINYEAVDDYRVALDGAVPDGVDIYLDNVGGPVADAMFTELNLDARVAVCGQIAHYNDEGVPTGPRELPQLIAPCARVQGLLVGGYATRFGQASEQLGSWVASGNLKHHETVVDGLGNVPDAFLGLFSGDNIGKQVVGVSES